MVNFAEKRNVKYKIAWVYVHSMFHSITASEIDLEVQNLFRLRLTQHKSPFLT